MKILCGAAAALELLVLVATGSLAGPAKPEVIELSAKAASEAFENGRPLVETSSYKVHASRREAPGRVEVHVEDTDVIHVLTGTATFVTGGTVVGGERVEPEEIRGSVIEGGETRRLEPGAVVIVPNGTPHWFKEVPAPMTYFVVKVRAAGAGQ